MVAESAALDLRTKRCSRCGEVKRWREYHSKARWPDGSMRQPATYCKRCYREYSRARGVAYRTRRKSDPERLGVHRAQQRDSARRRLGIPPERWRRDRPGEPRRSLGPKLEPGPFVEWLRTLGGDNTAIGRVCGLDESVVRRYLSGERRPTLGIVDEALVAADTGVTLDDLYPYDGE